MRLWKRDDVTLMLIDIFSSHLLSLGKNDILLSRVYWKGFKEERRQ